MADRPASRFGRALHLAFEWGLAGKAALAALELTGGLLIYFVDTAKVLAFVRAITLHELSEDPDDVVASHLLALAQGLSLDATTFIALYLVAHGVVKLALVVCLVRRLRWAYPATIVVLLVFVAYQLYRFTLTQAPGLIALSLFDLGLIALTWREYRLMPRPDPR